MKVICFRTEAKLSGTVSIHPRDLIPAFEQYDDIKGRADPVWNALSPSNSRLVWVLGRALRDMRQQDD